MASFLAQKAEAKCPVETCSNHTGNVPVGTKGAYAAFGKTAIGNQRWKCLSCKKTFSVNSKPTARQRQASKNRLIFKLLVNKSPMARIAEIAEVNTATVFHRLDFIHRQCQAFTADRERSLITLPIERLYISTDRQDYLVNWTTRKNRRNVVLSAVASVDNNTGYCFGTHLNFDPTLDPAVVEQEAAAFGDHGAPLCHRRHARVWLQADHDDASKRSLRKKPIGGSLDALIDDAYAIAQSRDDIEDPEAPNDDEKLPDSGMQTRLEYTLYGHFLYLRGLVRNVGKWRFFLDQDSGIRAACLAAFHDEIRDRSCDAFFVRISKGLTIDQKRKAIEKAREYFDETASIHPELDRTGVVRLLIKERLKALKPKGKWNDRWLEHPLPTMSEPEKAVCHLTDYGDYDLDHLASLYNKATLHGVDSLFNQIRRRVSMLERPIHSQGNAGRVWSGYAPYDPAQAARMLDIIRTAHNYVLVGEDGKTPAMRLGLAKAPLDYGDIIHFG